MLQDEEDYALIPRKPNRRVRVSNTAKVIAPTFDGEERVWENRTDI